MIDLRKTKDDASAAFAKGKFQKAAEGYAAYCKAEPKDLQIRLRLGDALAKAGDKAGAIAAYKISAEGFARDGFLPRAIAASKLILELDPNHSDVQKLLADLYAKKGVPAPVAKTTQSPVTPAPAGPKGETPLPPPIVAASRAAEAARPFSPPINRARVESAPEPEPVRGPPPALEAAPPTVVVAPELSHAAAAATATADEALVRAEPPMQVEVAPPEPAEPVGAAVESPPAPPEPPPPAPAPHAAAAAPAAPIERTSARAVESSPDVAALPIEVAPPPPPIALASHASDGATVGLQEVPHPAPAHASPLPVPAAAVPPPPPPPSRPNVPIDLQLDVEAALADAAPELPGAAPEPSASGALAAPPGLRPRKPAEVAPTPVAAPAISWPTPSKGRGAMTDLEKGLEALLQFEVEPTADSAPAAANAPAAESPPPAPALHDELVSVLHSVEAVSAGQPPPPPPGELVEELMDADLVEEAKPAAGAMPKIPLFSDLPESAFIALFEKCPLHRFNAGDVIFAQGSVGSSFYVVCGGAVRIIRGDGAKRGTLATLHDGAFFGEMALLSEAPRSASAVAAEEDTQLLEISAETLKALSAEHPQVSKALKKFCRQRMLSNVMNQSELFKPFSPKERRTLVEKFRARETKAGDVVIKQGAMSDGLYIVLSGEVGVSVGEAQVATLKEGEVFGEMSLLSRSQATATVAATKRTSLLRLPKDDFDTLIMSHPQILILVSELVEDRKAKNQALKVSATPSGDVMI